MGVVSANITFGPGIPGDAELRLCGDVSGAKRTVELGVSEWFNAVEFAAAGAKSIAVDPDPERIAEMRRRADLAELTVQCITGDLADLGDIASASCEVVVAVHSILDVDDLGRLLRQVHRVLKPSMPFVISMPHPFAAVTDDTAVRHRRTHGRRLVHRPRPLELPGRPGEGTRGLADASDPDDARAPGTQGRLLSPPGAPRARVNA